MVIGRLRGMETLSILNNVVSIRGPRRGRQQPRQQCRARGRGRARVAPCGPEHPDRYRTQEETHSFQPGTRKKVFFGAFIAWAIGWWVLAGVGGQLPYFDSINFVISFIAQILYVLKYNENWSLWIFVNIANFLYWSILSVQMMMGDNTIGTLGANLSQVALQAALLFNAVYAQKVWSSGEANNEGGAS